MKVSRLIPVVVALAAQAMGCGDNPDGIGGALPPPPTMTGGTPLPTDPVGPEMTGLKVVGNSIVNAQGQLVVLRGVNRSGTEYQCVHTNSMSIFDGPSDEPSIQAIASWKANAVRIPLNEACWLNLTSNGAVPAVAGPVYKQAILDYVALLHKYHIVPIVELHWVGPGAFAADRQQPMPDADHAPAFWADVAATFVSDDGVVFEPYNEPFPDSNKDSVAGWTCWRDGCTARQQVSSGTAATTYTAVGMQGLVDAIRSVGATNVILLGGIQYSNAMTQWLKYAPVDPTGNLAAAWHAYNFNACTTAANCWDGVLAPLTAMVPLVATEVGENDCLGTSFVAPLLTWLDGHGAGYLAWSWNAFGACVAAPPMMQGGRPWSLIQDYGSGAPNSGYAQTFHDRLLAM